MLNSFSIYGKLHSFLVQVRQLLAQIAGAEDVFCFVKVGILLVKAFVELCAPVSVPIAFVVRTPVVVTSDENLCGMRERSEEDKLPCQFSRGSCSA